MEELKMGLNLSALVTEQRNPNTMKIDEVSTEELCRLINAEDKTVPLAVEKELPQIAKAIDVIAAQIEAGGRLFYCGAGTSGRLGVLDASECPPTYGVNPGRVVGLIAGGHEALFSAREGDEDSFSLCEEDLRANGFHEKDVLCGIAASGRTPYVIGGMKYAKSLGATGAMIKLGKTYGNLMVDVQPTNLKLVARTRRIVMLATDATEEEAEAALSQCGNHPKTAILMLLKGVDAKEAQMLLKECGGRIKKALVK